MGLYSQTIKNLVSGISQQPPILRLPEQLEYQENGMSTEASGLQKRPPTIHIASLLSSAITPGVKPLVHLINRDEYEQYVVLFNGSEVHVWDAKGNKKTVNYATGAQGYITTTNPRRKLKAITVADYTFIVNIDKITAMTSEVTPNVWATQGALVNVKQGQYGRKYEIIVNGTSVATFTTPDGSQSAHSTQIDTNYIATQLKTGLTTAGYTVTQGEGWLYFYKAGVTISTLETKDGFNNNAMIGILKTVQKFSNLPAQAPDGFTVEVLGEPGSGADDYYVKYDAVDKVWKETAKPGIQCAFDASTMPHVLVREADYTFTLKPADWVKRETGDDDSNPLPSFIGQKINDLFFFRNRLGFIAGENVILSKAGEFFQFWMSSAVELQDTDPIDLAVSHNTVSILYHAVPFAEELLLFSAQTQFVLRAEGVLSPKNARLDQVTEFGCNTYTRPVGAGRRVYFPAERAQYTSIKEFYAVQDVTNVKNAQDITSHVPSYIPNGVYRLISSTIENILLILTEGAEDKIYVYKYLFVDEQRIQASWSHWTFNGGKILGGGFIGSQLYLVIQRDSGLFLEKMSFTYNTKDYDDEPYRVFLDRKAIAAPIPTQNYDSVNDMTTFDFKAVYGGSVAAGTYGLVTPDGLFRSYSSSEMTNGTVKLQGNWTGQKMTVGQVYNWKFSFSEIMLKQQDDRGTRADTEGRLQLRNFWVNYVESGYFKATVEHFDKQTFTYEMTARILGSGRNYLNRMPSETGIFKFPVQSLSANCRISIESTYPTPVSIIGAGWEGNYYRRSQRL